MEPQRLAIRQFSSDDLDAIYAICLATGDAGADASGLYRDPRLIGHVYAGPYVTREPELCFVLADRDATYGYVLGTRDSTGFEQWCESSWFAPLRQRYPPPAVDDPGRDARMSRLIHTGYRADPELAAWPAHLHIDLLPAAQGKGWGRRLLRAFIDRLLELDASGVHAVTGTRNPRAMAFYCRAGFAPIKAGENSIAYGKSLCPLSSESIA